MKIAISATDKSPESNISDVFGRCSYFIIAEVKDGKIEKIEAVKNENINQNSGAGVSSAQLIAQNNVNALISGNVGPRALEVLRQFNIKVYLAKGTVKDALDDFIAGKLKELN